MSESHAPRAGALDLAAAPWLLKRLGPARDYFGIALLGIGLWLLLIETNAFYSSVLATILIWTIATSGLNIIAGLGGYPSLVQGAFYGIGAYSSALAMKWGQPFWASCFEAVGAASLLGLVIGLVFSRTRGQYFAIGTMFSGLAVALVLNNWRMLTNGQLGISVDFGFADMDQLNIVIPAAAALTLALFRFVSRRRLGWRLQTILEDEDLAEHIGVPTARTKLAGFVLSAAIGAVAGVLIGQYNGTISPDLFDYYVGFVMFVALSVGGAGRVLGPLLGSAFIVGIPDLLNLSSGIGLLIAGLIFVLVIILIPGGFMSAIDAARALGRDEGGATMSGFLEVEGASKTFGGVRAVDAVDFSVDRGQDLWRDRSQWLRQDDPSWAAERHLSARSRRHPTEGSSAGWAFRPPHCSGWRRAHLPDLAPVLPLVARRQSDGRGGGKADRSRGRRS